MIEKRDLTIQCELIQNDLECFLDGLDQEVVEGVCRIVVDRFKILINRFDEKPNRNWDDEYTKGLKP